MALFQVGCGAGDAQPASVDDTDPVTDTALETTATGDADAASDSTSEGAPDVSLDAAGAAIPDPGTGAAPPVWDAPSTAGAPGTAYALGIVRSNPSYIGGTKPTDSGSNFFVFKSGPAFTSLSVRPTGIPPATIDYVHLHDGAGLVFGPEIAPTSVAGGTYTWSLSPNHVYVLEVRMSGGTYW